ncbi:MAG: hypothetical protein PHI35_09645, partial [Victivallaceae bacterium]|nr:hypothetical protein [Victivallaceae bacterium]
MSSIWLSKSSFDELWALTHNYRIRMSSNVKSPAVTVSGSGSRACVNILLPAQAKSGSSYNGYFKCVDATPAEESGSNAAIPTVGIIDGYYTAEDEDAWIFPAGYAVINDQPVDIEADTIELEDGENFIYLEFTVDETSEDEAIISELKSSTDKADIDPEDGKHKRLIANVIVVDNAIETIQQQSYGMIH